MTEAELQKLAELINMRQGFNFGNGIITALIAGVVSFLGIWWNNRSQRLSKEEEHKRKRREWFLEKQARDAEEIINSLEAFTKELIRLFKVTKSAVYTLSLLHNPRYWKTTSLHRKEMLDEKREDLEGLGREARKVRHETKAWFSYDAVRLTVWLENSREKADELEDLGERFEKAFVYLSRTRVGTGKPLRSDSELSEEEIEESLSKTSKRIGDYTDTLEVLTKDIAVFNHKLIESLREG